MKKSLLFVLMAAWTLAACTGEQKEKNFNVNVTLTDAEGETIYLQKFVDKELKTIDSAVIKDNVALLMGEQGDVQDLYALSIKSIKGQVNFFPENGDVTFTGDKTGQEEAKITASAAQELLNQYTDKYQDYYVEAYSLYMALMLAGQTEENTERIADSIKQRLEAIEEEMVSFQKDFVKSHADHFVAHYILDENKQDYSVDELKEYLSLFTTESVFKQDLEDHVAKLDMTSVGAIAPNFTLNSAEGQAVTLSELVSSNTYTLIDFWASWCGPCRAENPNVKAAYEKYHAKGFDVLGVSIDTDLNAWTEAVDADGLAWTQVIDIDQKTAEAYSIFYIPSNFLVDNSGKIVATSLRGDDLKAKLAEFLD